MLIYKKINIRYPSRPLIILDFDGVLCNSLELFIEIFNDLSSNYNYRKIKDSEINEFRNMTAETAIEYLGISKFKLYSIIKKIKKNMYLRTDELRSFDDIIDLLYELEKNKFNLGILTANKKNTVDKFLMKYDLHMFNFVIAARKIFNKSHYLNRIQKSTKIDSNNIFYISDEASDIEACSITKINSIAVTWGFNSSEILYKKTPTHIANTIQELQNIIHNNT